MQYLFQKYFKGKKVSILKGLFLILVLYIPSFSSDFGVKAQLTTNNSIGVGWGAGILGFVNLTNIFSFYPSLDFWYDGDYEEEYWDGYDWVYTDSYYINEFALNLDLAVMIPVKPVQPFLGFGLAPIITTEGWDYYEHTTVNAGFNIFGGILFPVGYTTSGMVELRGKFGQPYPIIKISAGLIFMQRHHHHRR
jgi:hypothetical protein